MMTGDESHDQTRSDQSSGDSERGKCTVHRCKADANRTLEWPDPGGLQANFCDDHARQKLAITKVSEITEPSVSSKTEQEGPSDA